jgi:hypothetical protein
MIRKGFLAALGLSLGLAAPAISQSPSETKAPKPVAVAPASPREADVSTIDGIVKAYYDVISGPAGQPRQWSRDRTLYPPDVRFVEIHEGKDGKIRAQVETHQQYVDRTDGPLVKGGFDEREIHRVTERFGSIANVFSTYESRLSAQGPVIARGINSLQLYHDGARWWIASATWQDESKNYPIPKEYLP